MLAAVQVNPRISTATIPPVVPIPSTEAVAGDRGRSREARFRRIEPDKNRSARRPITVGGAAGRRGDRRRPGEGTWGEVAAGPEAAAEITVPPGVAAGIEHRHNRRADGQASSAAVAAVTSERRAETEIYGGTLTTDARAGLSELRLVAAARGKRDLEAPPEGRAQVGIAGGVRAGQLPPTTATTIPEAVGEAGRELRHPGEEDSAAAEIGNRAGGEPETAADPVPEVVNGEIRLQGDEIGGTDPLLEAAVGDSAGAVVEAVAAAVAWAVEDLRAATQSASMAGEAGSATEAGWTEREVSDANGTLMTWHHD